jgi:2-polyprenyl-6-methoxyphenol hydroxylase-like FAD-dependent oxidoreductase
MECISDGEKKNVVIVSTSSNNRGCIIHLCHSRKSVRCRRRDVANNIQVGGSICGLMHGIMLKRLGHNVHVLEQANSARAGYAAGITARSDVLEFMKTYDLTGEDWFISSPDTQFINKLGEPTKVFQKMLCMTSWSVLYHRLRANFDGLESVFAKETPKLSDSDGNVVFDEGKRVVDLRDVGKQVEVKYQDVGTLQAQTLLADLVIGADGSNSFVRQKMLPEIQRQYSGYVAFRGCVPQEDVSTKTLKTFIDKLTIFKGSNPKNYILL